MRRAPCAWAIYAHELLRREVISFLGPLRFFELDEAVKAAVGAGGGGEICLVRNVTLPEPRMALRSPKWMVWASVPQGAALTLRSKGAGSHWRIRHYWTYGGCGCALFGVNHGARLEL